MLQVICESAGTDKLFDQFTIKINLFQDFEFPRNVCFYSSVVISLILSCFQIRTFLEKFMKQDDVCRKQFRESALADLSIIQFRVE